MSQPLSGTNPLFEDPEVIVEDENGGGRITPQNTTSEQVEESQTEANESEHDLLKPQQCSGGTDNDSAIELQTDGGIENTGKPSDVITHDESKYEEKGEASKQVVPGKMTVDQSLPIIKVGTHEGGQECPCEDCYKKRKTAEIEAGATIVTNEGAFISSPPSEELSPPTLSPSTPSTPAPPSPSFGPAEANSTLIVEAEVLTTAPSPSEKPSSPPDLTTPLVPTPSPPHIPPPHTPSPHLLLVSSPPPLSPPAEDTYFLIPENQDATSEEPEEQELTEEEQKKTHKIVEDLYEELIEEKTGGCCRGCCHLWCWDCCGRALTIPGNDQNGLQNSKEVFTPALKKAVGGGVRIFLRLVWPLAPTLLRDVWVSLEWILGLLALILSIIQFAVTGGGEVFNSIHFTLSIFGFLLASIDGLVQLSEGKSCKICYHLCCGKEKGRNEDKESDKLCCCCCNRLTKGGKNLVAAKNVFDVARTLISELILYPMLLCNFFGLILHKGWEFENTKNMISFILFLLSLASLILFVYILRIILLFIMLVRAQKTRQKLIEKTQQKSISQAIHDEQPPPCLAVVNQTTQGPENNKTINPTAGKWFSGYFFIHIVFQMIAQILMIIAICAKFQYENRNYDKDNTIHISSYLWYMIITGYILPFCGFLTFFIVNFYWAREFPIKLYIQILSVLSSPNASSLFFPKDTLGKDGEGLIAKWREIVQHVNSTDLKNVLVNDFKEMAMQGFVQDKLGFPFRSPGLIILCVVYAVLQLSFVICASQNDVGDDVIINEGGWTIFYVCAIVLWSIANMYTYAVAYFWMCIFGCIGLIGVIICCCCLICYSQPIDASDNTNRVTYTVYTHND